MREIKRKQLNLAILIGVFVNVIVIGAFGSLLLRVITLERYYFRYWGDNLRVARTSNPMTMDPCDSWDRISTDMLDQVVETLIAYDLTDPELPLVGRLAESWYWADNLTIVFQLRENVIFHDGTRLNGSCVLHTFERINFFGNWTGKLDPALCNMASPHSLYKFADGIPIFNHTLSIIDPNDELNVSLVLNRPFAPAEELLTYTSSAILHPHSTPVNDMLEIGVDLVIGTGPYKLFSYVPNSEIIFLRWERYWRTGTYWENMIYICYRDAVTANNAILALDIDYLGEGIASLRPDFEADPDITITGDGIHDDINGSNYNYILFKSEWINRTWRKAICHAFNYTYLIRDIKEDMVSRAHSLVPPGFPAYNSSIVGGRYNIPYARQLLQSMGYGYTGGVPWDIGSQIGDVFFPGADEALWTAAEFIPNLGNFTNNEWRFKHRQGSYFMELLIQRFTEDMEIIGIKVTPVVWTWGPIPDWLYERVHLYFYERNPKYFSTFNKIDSLINPEFSPDVHKVDNTEINNLLADCLTETDILQRYHYYEKLQYLIHDKYYYHMPLFYDKIHFVHSETLRGFPYNPMQMLYFYPTYRD
jgi:ABC-type transport system substrate-binding protein